MVKHKRLERAGGIIFNEDFTKILLIKGHQAQKWGVPKGHINANETYLKCCSREVWEETGISVMFCNEPRSITSDRAKLYIMHAIKSRCKLDPYDKKEIMEIAWKDINEITAPAFDCTRMLKKVISSIGNIINIAKTTKCNTINSIIIVG